MCRRKFFEFFHFLLALQLAYSSSTNFPDQSALLAFKSAITNDPKNSISDANWTSSKPLCHWNGVSCAKHGLRVRALNLSFMALQGSISPHLGNLSFLNSLDLGNNSFHGGIPGEIGRLHRLRTLILRFNNLEGGIPPSLRYCQNLELLSLEGNRLTGGIPEEIGSLPRLGELYLSLNKFINGVIPSSLGNISTLRILSLRELKLQGSIPYSLLNLSSLVILDLTRNDITGNLPVNLCHGWPRIQLLHLSFNHLGGHLPSNFSECKDLVSLSLGYNGFEGTISGEIGRLQKLQLLNLGGNNLTGKIPSFISNMTALQRVYIDENYISGNIPEDLGSLPNIREINFEMNNLSGEIPRNILNISSLEMLSLMQNSLSGNLPSDGLWLPNLQRIFLSGNKLSGNIPLSLSNSSNLVHIDFARNFLTGPIPSNLGNLQHLRYLALQINQLKGEPGSPELSFLTALSNCRSLETLVLHSNPLKGSIPESIGNFSTSLRTFYAPDCQLKGNIPSAIGSLEKLALLELSSNDLTGNIPLTIKGLEMLQEFNVADNKLKGFIPVEICYLKQLTKLTLQNNNISGSIPACFEDLNGLQILALSSNRLSSSIPPSLWGLKSLRSLNLSFNSLSGYLPSNVKSSIVLEEVDFSSNKIVGTIPSIIGEFESLTFLSLSRNSIQGHIPESLSKLKGLDSLDLSYNNLSGTIPNSLETLRNLKHLNLSFNQLSGEIPSSGAFANFTVKSFMENPELCSGNPNLKHPTCASPKRSKAKNVILKYILPAIASIIFILVILIYATRKYRQKRSPNLVDKELPGFGAHPLISYQELCRATYNFSESNWLGKGSSGSVYKGVLANQTIVAIKVLNLQHETALKSFDSECKVLRSIRQRNLVKVITTCSNNDIRALVLEYMPNGSLEKWLYSQKQQLDLLQRISIMLDVASALEYLHNGLNEPVVHCDVKPSNILLDEEMVGHLADFGIAKILIEDKEETQTRTLGTIGYIAPEYGSEGRVSSKGDVYSYGVMLLETITRRRPTDPIFDEEMSLRKWVKASSHPEKILKIVDPGLMGIEYIPAMQSVLYSIMELGLECTEQLPEKRIGMKDVVVRLTKIKSTLLLSINSSI